MPVSRPVHSTALPSPTGKELAEIRSAVNKQGLILKSLSFLNSRMIICLFNVRKATISVGENGDHHRWHLVSPYFLFADRAEWDIKSVEAALA